MFIGVGIFIAVLRLLKVDELGYFMLDEERDAFLVRRMLVDRRPLLIGGAIPGGINVGPLFFYISAIPYYFSLLNPIGPAYAAGVVGGNRGDRDILGGKRVVRQAGRIVRWCICSLFTS